MIKGKNKALKFLLKVNIFSIHLKDTVHCESIDSLVKSILDTGAVPNQNMYIANSFTRNRNKFIHLEMEKMDDFFYKVSLHIVTKRYKQVRDVLKKESVIKTLRAIGGDLSVEFGTHEVPWVQWQSVPALSLVQYFKNKGYDLASCA